MTVEFWNLQIKGYPAATWTGTNPTLKDREPGIETDTGKIKIGKDNTPWNSLAYWAPGGGGDLFGPSSSTTGNMPVFSGTTGKLLADGGINPATLATAANLTAHTGSTSNPHAVTQAQVGLALVNNTSDADKPISTAVAAAFAAQATINTNLSDTDQSLQDQITALSNSSGAADVILQFRKDYVDATVTYYGESQPATDENYPGWRIWRKTTASDGDVSIVYAGTGALDQVWADHLTLGYGAALPPPPPPPPVTDYTYSNLVISDMALSVSNYINSTKNLNGLSSMGLHANNRGSPTWWNSPTYNNANDIWWQAIAGWFVSHPVAGHTATNSKLEIGTYVLMGRLAADNSWFTIFNKAPNWCGIYNPDVASYISAPTTANGTVSGYTSKVYNLPTDGVGNVLHGGVGSASANPQALNGLAMFVAARITGTDTANCNIKLQVGADWYPTLNFNVSGTPPGWIIAACASGPKTVTTSWQMFGGAPLMDPGRRGGDSAYTYRRANNIDMMDSATILSPNGPIPNPGVLPP